MRVLKYLKGTINLFLTLTAVNTNVIKWWVDGAYAVHPDMRSHTRGMMSLGRGCVYGTSTKQKLNTKSSTETELVSTDDVMPQILWTNFLKDQGYAMWDMVVYQDNQSAVLLENGKGSSGKRMRHINVQYFFF